MTLRPRCHERTIPWLLLSICLVQSGPGAPAEGHRAIAASVQPIATQAALSAMRAGGNAIDGAVAAALTLGVVDGHNSGIGGGCFMLVRLTNGSLVVVDGRETAPARAQRDMFVRDGKADPELSQTGALAAGVPGSLAAYDYAVRQYGKLSLKEHLLRAAEIAERGFRIDASYARRLAETAKDLQRFEETRRIFFHGSKRSATSEPSNISVYREGEVLKQTDLAETYRHLAKEGIDWFYRGPFASKAEQWMKENGGLLSASDFEMYQSKLRESVTNTYRGFVVIGFPPPSSGGVHVAQILNILEQFDLRKLGHNSADFVHVVAEAMKLAFADRAFWLGDPDFVDVPRGLVSKNYAARQAARIQMDRVIPVDGHDTPDDASINVFGKHTTHFCTADEAGNWVAITATINTSFGSKVVVPGTGVILNNQMDDFAIQPGVANYFGLIGAEANSVGPKKRPLSSMSPTIVLKDGKPVFSVGAAGGPTIISQTVLAIINTIDFGMPPDRALAAARFHHQWRPDELRIERKIGKQALDELARRGHHLVPVESFGSAQAISFNPANGTFAGAADPRSKGEAAGF